MRKDEESITTKTIMKTKTTSKIVKQTVHPSQKVGDGIFNGCKFFLNLQRGSTFNLYKEKMNKLGAKVYTKDYKPAKKYTHIILETCSKETFLKDYKLKDCLIDNVFIVRIGWYLESRKKNERLNELEFRPREKSVSLVPPPVQFIGPTKPEEHDIKRCEDLLKKVADKLEKPEQEYQQFLKIKHHPNIWTITAMRVFNAYYQGMRDFFRVRNYNNAIDLLTKKNDAKVGRACEAEALGLAGKLKNKIEELVQTGKHADLDHILDDGKFRVMTMFTNIWGVGNKTAKKFFDAGCRELQDIQNKFPGLNESQKIGIEHYEDFNARIPYNIVTKHYQYVKNALAEIDPSATSECMGSYRRGKSTCGDIDIMILKLGCNNMDELISIKNRLVDLLTARGYIKATLVGLVDKDGKKDSSRWLGATSLEEEDSTTIWRRVDLFVWEWNRRGAAALHCTGSLYLNISLAMKAMSMRMKLTERGLYTDSRTDDERKRQRANIYLKHDLDKEETLIAAETEEAIFTALGLEYIPPQDRTFYTIVVNELKKL